jgi:hypothetical protein
VASYIDGKSYIQVFGNAVLTELLEREEEEEGNEQLRILHYIL